MSLSDPPREFPPDFVSADTLAYRLDCSRSTIDAYVRQGRLPPPYQIGSLIRWDFAAVRAFIQASVAETTVESGIVRNADDPYLKALAHGPSASR
jgi:predicted DNA-binding transcriptional regulator AlpA